MGHTLAGVTAVGRGSPLVSALALRACAGLAAFVVACTASAPPGRQPLGKLRTEAFRRVPLGLCEDYPEESRSLEGVRRDLELLSALGVDTLRVSIGWDSVEPEKDRYDFAFWDAFVDLAVQQYGLTLIPYVAYTPEWNGTGGPTDFWKSPPRDHEEFAEVVGLLARRYHGSIHSWELWNEPDNRDYWLGSARDYAELLSAGARAVDEVDPELQVVFGGLAGTLDFLRDVFELGAAEQVDVVNLHSYYETWNPEPLETITEYVAGAEDIVRHHGGRQAIWMAEVGYSNFRRGREVSLSTTATFDYEHTLDYQAVALVRTVALLLSAPAVSLVAWYELKDPPPGDDMIGDVNNRHLGVAFTDHSPKPAAQALAFMQRLFGPGFQGVDRQLHVERRTKEAAEVHGFVTPRGTLLVIAWLPSPRDAAFGPSDFRRQTVQVSAPFVVRGPINYFDELGHRVGASPAAASAGSGSEVRIEIELVGGQVRIVEVPIGFD